MDVAHFLDIKPDRQLTYLEGGDFAQRNRKEKLDFLKSILKEEPPAVTTACALRMLKKLNYLDRYYFKKFLYHPDNAVVNVARETIKEWYRVMNIASVGLVDMLKEGDTDDRILLVNYFLESKGKIDENTLISFLRVGDLKAQEFIVAKVTQDHNLDDSRLCKAIQKGAPWYVRAALVEILGNRKYEHLFDCIDFLMNDKNVEVKLKLIDALVKLEMEKGKTYLEKLAKDPVIWVRKKAQQALCAF